MSYRLVDANELALVIPEVNMMPCIYADLPNGLDGKHYTLKSSRKGHWIYDDECKEHGHCDKCGYKTDLVDGQPHNFCPKCGAEMEMKNEIYI